MEHKGIEYSVRRTPGNGRPWGWRAHISPPKTGRAASHIYAIIAAKNAITIWCKQNPTLCAPHPAQPIDLGATDPTVGGAELIA